MDGLYHMEVDETVRPVVRLPRKVPLALRDRLKEKLDKLVKEGIITPATEPTKWASGPTRPKQSPAEIPLSASNN